MSVEALYVKELERLFDNTLKCCFVYPDTDEPCGHDAEWRFSKKCCGRQAFLCDQHMRQLRMDTSWYSKPLYCNRCCKAVSPPAAMILPNSAERI